MRLRIGVSSLLLNNDRFDLCWLLLIQFIADADSNNHSNENGEDDPENDMSGLCPDGGDCFSVKNLEVHLAFDKLAEVLLVLW